MNNAKISECLQKRYHTENVKFLGRGTDSTAWAVNDCFVCRFPHSGDNVYKSESAICDYIRPNISVNIPKIEFIDDVDIGGFAFHKMIKGHKWSWHKFAWKNKMQNNLADSIALFLSQLHKTDIEYIKNNITVPQIKYIPFSATENALKPYLPQRLIRRINQEYNRIVSTVPAPENFVLCHMGVKGPNSVVDDSGRLCGVFDFGNAGIYERWCDLAVIATSKNRRLYNRVLRKYSQYSGVAVDRERISDMIFMEVFWAKRWRLDNNGNYTCGNDWACAKTSARLISSIYGVPYIIRKIVLMPLICLHARMYRKRQLKRI